MSQVLAYLKDEDGASAAEYALILAVIGAAIAVAGLALSHYIGNGLTAAGTCISTKGVTC
jgi:pilus assembly protein Flp/PilA